MGTIFGVVLTADFEPAKAKTSFLDYPWSFSVLEFFAFVVGAGSAHTLDTTGGRAVIQWGPPALSLDVVEAFTLYGMIWCVDTFDVLWSDKWDTPKAYVIGDSVRIIPAATMTSECPPLGGCY